jgi:hypothetical protein
MHVTQRGRKLNKLLLFIVAVVGAVIAAEVTHLKKLA